MQNLENNINTWWELGTQKKDTTQQTNELSDNMFTSWAANRSYKLSETNVFSELGQFCHYQNFLWSILRIPINGDLLYQHQFEDGRKQGGKWNLLNEKWEEIFSFWIISSVVWCHQFLFVFFYSLSLYYKWRIWANNRKNIFILFCKK